MACCLGYQIQGLENSKSFSYHFLNEKCPRNIFAKTDILMYFLVRIWFLLFHFSFSSFLKKFKVILWNSSCQEEINPVVSNISCFSVCKPGTHRLFILVQFRKRTWIILFKPRITPFRSNPKTSSFNLWKTWWGGVSEG